MTKSGRLTKVEICYIDNNLDKSAAEIAADLDRTESAIQKHLDKIPEETKTEAKKLQSQMMSLIGRRKGSVIMTPAASELADATKTKRNNLNRMKDVIFRPMD